jgi:L-lactate utilization protein LutB
MCGRCKARCPMEIDVPGMMIELKKHLVEGDTAAE